MTTTIRVTNIYRTVLFAALLAPAAFAGCGDTRGLQGPFTFVEPSSLAPSVHDQALSIARADAVRALESQSIVGMWNITFVSAGNTLHSPPIPDGAMIDFGYSVWHSDGTEILNSGSRAPATENFCLGVWARTGYATFQLNHFALSYDQNTGLLNGKVQIRETVTLSPDGTSYTGTFTLDVFDTAGKVQVDHVQGNVVAKRVTVTSTFP